MDENLDEKPDAILITGPTASGKSALAIRLARAHGGVVVNADSMQVYDTLRVLTARPGPDDMAKVPHYLYGHVPAATSYSTGAWLRDAARLLETLRAEGRMPVFVGGTGLYFMALTGGLADMPPVPPVIRDRLRARLQEEGPEVLHRLLWMRDPETAEALEPADGQRVVRALEIIETTGRSIREFQRESGTPLVDPARALKIVVLPERSVLHSRIDVRFAAMLSQGAIDEVKALLAQDLPAALPIMKAIGVPQIAAYLNGRIAMDALIATGSAATRQYAKRQMTWLRNRMDESWRRIDPQKDDAISG